MNDERADLSGDDESRGAATEGRTAQGPERGEYTQLPEPIRLEDTITSADVVPDPEVKGEDRREREWMLRYAGFG